MSFPKYMMTGRTGRIVLAYDVLIGGKGGRDTRVTAESRRQAIADLKALGAIAEGEEYMVRRAKGPDSSCVM